jgi:PilZ domain
MSLGGLFIETRVSKSLGSTVKLEFLVQEGQIRADGVVKRVDPSRGMALKFTAVSEQDRPRLAKLMVRLRQSS